MNGQNGNGNFNGLTATTAKIGFLSNAQTAGSQASINSIGKFSPRGELISVNPDFAKPLLQQIFILDNGAIIKKIISEVFKELCKNGCIPEDCCYYYNNECCGDNMAKNITNTIFKSMDNNNSFFTDDNFSLLSTEIIEDNLESTKESNLNLSDEKNNLINDDVNSINSIITENEE